jgi:hypothetical protein
VVLEDAEGTAFGRLRAPGHSTQAREPRLIHDCGAAR